MVGTHATENDAVPVPSAPIVASTAVRRKYLGVAEEVTQMSNQLAFLSTQPEAVDAAFFVCVAYAPAASTAAATLGGTSTAASRGRSSRSSPVRRL